jgi:hypothetical protein
MCSAQKLEHPELQELHSLICKHRATVFPVSFFDDLIDVMDKAPPEMEHLRNSKRLRVHGQSISLASFCKQASSPLFDSKRQVCL